MKVTNLTFAIFILPAFEFMLPAALEKNRDFLVKIRVMVKDSSVFWKKARALDNVTFFALAATL